VEASRRHIPRIYTFGETPQEAGKGNLPIRLKKRIMKPDETPQEAGKRFYQLPSMRSIDALGVPPKGFRNSKGI
jgi:hypothetical protein